MPIKKKKIKGTIPVSVNKKTTKARKAAKRPIKIVTRKLKKNKQIEKMPVASLAQNLEQKIEESKYYPGPVIQKFEGSTHELPRDYGDNRIVLLVRDPYWLYAYWELSIGKINEIKRELKNSFYRSSLILRVYDTSNWKFFDIGVNAFSNNWYINVGRPNTSFCVDIGYLTPEGFFLCAARSNVVVTPRDQMSDVIDEEWMIPDWERMYALSGGFGYGLGSHEIREMIEKRRYSAPSSWISSSSSSKPPLEKSFWLSVNCELIVYGATLPSAKVKVQGAPVKLREDGTFSLRFSLPDGFFEIPVEAQSFDSTDQRTITPTVERRTH